ncbi:hypothetical protein D3C87_1436030 [compost metagenome]
MSLGDKAAQVATAHIGLDHHATAAVVATDLVWPLPRLDDGDRGQGRDHPAGGDDRQGGQAGRVIARLVGQTHHHVKAAVALEDAARLRAAHRRGHRLADVRRRQAVAGGVEAIHADRQGGQARHLFDLDVRRARRLAQAVGHLVGDHFHLLEILAIDHDGQVAAHARDHLVEAQFDRLAELEGIADLLAGRLLDPLDQGLFRQLRVRPGLAVLQDDDAVRDIDRHGIDRRLGGAGA